MSSWKKYHIKQQLRRILRSVISYEIVAGFLLVFILVVGSVKIFKHQENKDLYNVATVIARPKPIDNVVKPQDNNIEKVIKRKVRSGDSLGSILGKSRIESIEIYSAIKALNRIFKSTKLRTNDKVYIYYQEMSQNGDIVRRLNKIKLQISDTVRYEVIRTAQNDFYAQKIEVELFSKLQVKSGEIKTSLYQDAEVLGIPAAIIVEFIRFYSFDLDFQRDIRKGDKFKIFYETFYNSEGEFVKNGDIIYCNFEVGNRKLTNYKYTTTKGSTLYFNEQGSSVKKALMRTPINGARMSSSFGYRKHPILGYNKLHTGVDFAARTGTPIFAAGNGTIDKIGWNGGYGRYIRIRHNSRYSTAYAHLSRFAKGMKKGRKVKQRQVIGYVGTTGRSTGPHLHYEVLSRGKPINPRTLRPESKIKLKGQELAKFKTHKSRIDFILENAF